MIETISPDTDPEETQEWLDSLESVIREESMDRAQFLLEKIIDKMRQKGANLLCKTTSAYINTIDPKDEPIMPGNQELEERISSIIRRNALAMVIRASRKKLFLGGHISTYASLVLYMKLDLIIFLERGMIMMQGI